MCNSLEIQPSSCIFCFVADHKEELTKLQDKYKEEKQERKKLKAKLEHMEEEIQEAKQENESIAKVGSIFCIFEEVIFGFR